MTDPAEIAKKLTPAQVLSLRSQSQQPYPHVRRISGVTIKKLVEKGLLNIPGPDTRSRPITDLGRAVLAALDAKEST